MAGSIRGVSVFPCSMDGEPKSDRPRAGDAAGTLRRRARRPVSSSVSSLICHLLMLVPMVACGAAGAIEPPDEAPKYGIIRVDMSTSGDRIYPDSVEVTVDSDSPFKVPSNGSHDVHNIPVGVHTISVSGIPDDCTSASDSRRDVSVTGGRATTVSFVFSCKESIAPPTGVIVFSRLTPTSSSHLWKVGADGSGEAQLTNIPGATEDKAAWMPDGKRLVFAMFLPDVGSDDIAVVSADGSGLVNLTNSVAHETTPSVSPDGTRIAFSMYSGSGVDGNPADYDIWVMNVDGTNRKRLTQDISYDIAPIWSPDGREIAFLRAYVPYIMDADGSDVRPMRTPEGSGPPGAQVLHMAWSPDGSRLAVEERSGVDDRQIYTTNPDGTDRIQLTTEPGDNSFPTWSPDGGYIAFSSSRTGVFAIYVMRANGANQQRISSGTLFDLFPAWQPIPATEAAGRR